MVLQAAAAEAAANRECPYIGKFQNRGVENARETRGDDCNTHLCMKQKKH